MAIFNQKDKERGSVNDRDGNTHDNNSSTTSGLAINNTSSTTTRPNFLRSHFYLSLDDIKSKTRAFDRKNPDQRANNEGINNNRSNDQKTETDPLVTPPRRYHTNPPSPTLFAAGKHYNLPGNLKNSISYASHKLLDTAYGANIRSPVLARSRVESNVNSVYASPSRLNLNDTDHDYFNLGNNYGSISQADSSSNNKEPLDVNAFNANYAAENFSVYATGPHQQERYLPNRHYLSQSLTTEDFPMVAPEISNHFIESENHSIFDNTNSKDAPIKRNFYDDFTLIDWVYDNQKLSALKSNLKSTKGLRGKITRITELMKDWLLVAVVAFVFAVIAYVIDKCEFLLVDLRRGYCSSNWLSNENFCCPYNGGRFLTDENAVCEDWVPWSTKFESIGNKQFLEFVIYCFSSLILAFLAVLITLTTKSDNPLAPSNKNDVASAAANNNSNHNNNNDDKQSVYERSHSTRVIYSAAGSGVPEVKTILSGFVIRKFLGVFTLITKSTGLIFAIASGLTIGKEGPYVHLASCVGNLCCRIFKKYNDNELVKRQILSASTGAGFALSFGSPLGGVLFSLEEITYYFAGSQLFKTFFCAIVSILFMKLLDPYGTGNPVMFETNYTSEWKPFELTYFILIGVAGGLHGAFFCKFAAIWWPKWFRNQKFIKNKFIKEVLLLSLATSSVTFFNSYTRRPIPELLADLARSCDYSSNKPNELCPRDFNTFPKSITTLLCAFLIKLVFTAITYGIKVPSGIYVPSMVLGATFGRTFALIIQYLQVQYPQFFITPDVCSIENGGACIDFGIYAMIGAGAFMAGITRMNVTLAITLFEITASYTYVLPISISIAVANWVANSIEPNSLYELLIINHNFPFLKSNRNAGFSSNSTIQTLVDNGFVNKENKIVLDEELKYSTTMTELRAQLVSLQQKRMIDGCIPVLQDDTLVGILPAPDLEFALDKLREFCTEYNVRKEVICRTGPETYSSTNDQQQHSDDEEGLLEASCSVMSSRQLLGVEVLNELTDFTNIIDSAPIQLDITAKLSLVEQIFKRVGNRSICVLRRGKFIGVLHKKDFITFCREKKYY